jgi:5-(carboxyamino)imidazole ribonucleotide synthase
MSVLLPDRSSDDPTRRVTLGVMGGGQLGRMFVHAAQAMGYRAVVLDPDPDSPAGRVADAHIVGDYLDEKSLQRLTDLCDAITTEFENVPAQALEQLARTKPVAPSAQAVAVCQHRAREKARFVASGVPCVPHAVLESPADALTMSEDLFPAVLKTSTLGYDGKGQVSVAHRADLQAAWNELGGVPCLVEKRVSLQAEFSVIVARNSRGECVHLPVQQNLHRGGILAVTQVPAPELTPEVRERASAYADQLAAGLNYVGVLCVEFFLLTDGRILANEMAPRPHNSGHYSVDACDVSQFELQVRALAGLPLVSPRMHSASVMINLLGDLWFPGASPAPKTPAWDRVMALPGAHLHLYGKSEPRRGRKMGHLTITADESATALEVANRASALLGLPEMPPRR